MTLGGLALAIGILVDEATVEIENIHHKMEGNPFDRPGRPAGEPGHGRPSAPGDALYPRGVPARPSSCKGAAQVPVRTALARGRLRDDLLVPALEHVRPGPLDLAAPSTNRGPCRRERGRLGLRSLSIDALRSGSQAHRASRWRWIVVPAYLAGAVLVTIGIVGPTRPGDFPQGRCGSVPAPPASAPTGTRIEKTELDQPSPPSTRSEGGRGGCMWRSRWAMSG